MQTTRQTAAQWQADMLAVVPGLWRERVRRVHSENLGQAQKFAAGTGAVTQAEQAANTWLLDTTERMRALRVPVTLSDDELCDKARQCAKECFALVEIAPGIYSPSLQELRARMSRYCERYAIPAPGLQVQDAPAVRRMTDDAWWRRGLRVAQARALEREAIGLGYVKRGAEMYASEATVERRGQQRRRNAAALENTIATNTETGEEFRLAELAALSVANPRIRRGELMTRLSGFESVANGVGHVGVFFTVTCPSRMHKYSSRKNGSAYENKKFDGTTPREAQKYLTTMWAKTRAALARQGAAVYGFRIAEPHHDAAPHWHLILFMPAERMQAVCKTFARYARQEDAHEMSSKGARKARFCVKVIEPGSGSATGYVAKYISKNIDGGGYEVQGDIEGSMHEEYTASHRVEAWASTWGIRQFQQIGGAPVGVWRELRRMKVGIDKSKHLNQLIAAADCGRNSAKGKAGAHWACYTDLMGGASVQRKNMPVRVAYTGAGERFDCAAGAMYAAPENRYGEPCAAVVYGVRDIWADSVHASSRSRWEIGSAKKPESYAVQVLDFDLKADFSPPWSPVNNCTRTEIVQQDKHEKMTFESWEKMENEPVGWFYEQLKQAKTQAATKRRADVAQLNQRMGGVK